MGFNSIWSKCTVEFQLFTSAVCEQTIEVRYEDKTIWFSQKMMAVLFDVSVSTINEHLKNISDSCELTCEATIRKFRIVQTEGNREVIRNPDYYSYELL
jgi:hypothetical protein